MNLQVMQALQQLLGNNTAQAKRYANNPRGSEFIGVDPARFGYPADNSGSQLQVQPALRHLIGTNNNPPLQAPGDSGLTPQPLQPNWQQPSIQGGQYNPGRIPLQQSNLRYRQTPQPTQPWYDF